MCFSSNHKPINCIVPPHMLDVLILRGDKKTKEMARSLMGKGVLVRDKRQAMTTPSLVKGPTSPGNVQVLMTPALATPATGAGTVYREIHDGQNKAGLPGKPVRVEGEPATNDSVVDEAYDGAGHVYDLYHQEFERDSLDGNGMRLIATVHHRKNYNNAFWDGQQMAYGDGDGRIFKKFTDLSVIGHEMSHGVVQYSGGLLYHGESGALNESFADVFGALTVQRKMKQTACEADWLIGNDILGNDINGEALRSMKAPGTAYSDPQLGQDPQPYHMDLYVNTTQDYGGVHINSGIPNHAFYLFAQYIGGNAWEIPGTIWYTSLQTLNNPHATFIQWAEKTIETSIRIYGTTSKETRYLRRAWKLVGLNV